MNKIIYTLLLLTIVSCNSIDIAPATNDIISPDFTTAEGLKSIADGMYAELKEEGGYTGFIMAFGEWPADNLKIASENTGQGAIPHEWDYEEGAANLLDMWETLYRSIRNANFVIENSGLAIDEQDQANIYAGEAYVTRALAHYELAKAFGAGYSNGGELAVPYVTDATDIFQTPARETYESLYTSLKSDLTLGIDLITSDFDPNRASKALGYGVLARIALTEGDYQAAAMNAGLAIDNAPAVATLDNYLDMFGENDEDGESIFKLALNPDDNGINDPYFAEGVGPRFDPTSDLLSLYDANDIRLVANFLDLGGRLIIGKYRGPATNRDFHEPFVMRVSEMHLIRAEANAELGNDADARADLDALRSNRIPGYTSVGETGAALIEAVRIERRKELAYEGFRFYDIRRWGQAVERTDCTSDVCVLAAGSFRFSFPIPRAEIFANDNMTQNQGY